MKNEIYGQLARTRLLSESESAAILAGNVPPLDEIITTLLIGAMDCEAMTAGDPKSGWNEKRLARQCLTIAFLLAIVAAEE